MKVKKDARFYTRLIIVGVGLIAIAILGLSCASSMFDNACRNKGGTVSITSNGYHTCSK